MQLNRLAKTLCDTLVTRAEGLRLEVTSVAGARLIDFGINSAGGLLAGCQLARVCLADLAQVSLTGGQPTNDGGSVLVQVSTDHPLWSCLGGQYAGWPVQADDFFAMGSGPMRLARGREEMLTELKLGEPADAAAEADFGVVGVLETSQLPGEQVIQTIAEQCGVATNQITLCVAPVTSLAGIVQVVARSVETAMHKMHAVGLPPAAVLSGFGVAPLPPVATDMVQGIGQTNDAILYAGRVTLWVDLEQSQIDELGPKIPSNASSDYGRPFAEIFKAYKYDFYQVDPGLFSPAVVEIVNVRSGLTRTFGQVNLNVFANSCNYQPDMGAPF